MEIIAYYTSSSSWDMQEVIDQLDIDIAQVLHYQVKWNTLFLTYKDKHGDSTTAEIEPTLNGISQFGEVPDEIEDESFTEALETAV